MRLSAVLLPEAEHDDLALSIVYLYKNRFIMEYMISYKATAHKWIAVEIAPPFDPSGNTALVAATIMFEILCLLAESITLQKK